ncbi:MAG: DNA repair and recombination protein rad54b, variant 3 [Marteilia pararefringens]
MSYEMFLSNINILNDFNFQLMVCDEAHRLKNSSNKLYQQIKQFKAHFKLLLTGTPIQNNIEELYALIELVDPNFRQNYSNLIDPNDDEKEKNQKLQDYTSAVMLGRTTSILDNILPPKTDHILVFKIDDNFKLLYSNLVNSILKKLEDNTKEIGSNFLHILVILRKLLNSPELLDHGDIEKLSEIGCRENFVKTSFKSPKVRAIQDLFQIIDKDKISDKVVIVSSFTKVLDLLQRLSQDYKFETSRLDGNTAMNKRMQIVNDFNNKETAQKVLLLSNKAGGVGLNLIGVSILILFDIDWNPSNDAQAIGRVWRPGQLKDVKIYRFITSGTLEEKMMQRQCSKRNTSDNFFDTCEFSSNKFDGSNLLKTAINLLSFNPDSNSYLHDQLDCSCTQGDEASDNIIMKENLSKQINQSSESRDSLLEITDSNFLIKRQKLEANPNSSLSEVRKWRHVKSNNVSRTYDDCFILAIQDSLNFCFSDN